MRDKRPVDELSIEELERILAIRKREERQQKLKRMERAGRIIPAEMPVSAPVEPAVPARAPSLERVLASNPGPSSAPRPAPPPSNLTPQFEDEGDERQREERSRFWRGFFSQALFLVEAAAVVGLLFIGYQMFIATNRLQTETANAQALGDEQRRANLPTLVPTPQIQLSQVVLPGGHTILASGEAQFNYDEVPEALRYLVADQVLQPIAARPRPTTETALEISIPKLNIEQSIVQGTDWEALKLGVGQLLNGVNPGDDEGNLVLSAHNDIYSEIFRYIDQLEAGDEFFVRTQTQVYRYVVTGSDIVKPNDISVLNPRGGAVATLISCYPYKVNTERYIVFAERVDNEL